MDKSSDITLEALKEITDELVLKLDCLARANDEISKENTQLAREVAESNKIIATLKTTIKKLEEDKEKLSAELTFHKTEYDKVISQLLLANARAFGVKSEKYEPYQLSLFNDIEASHIEGAPEVEIEDVVAKRPRKKRTTINWDTFETVVVNHELSEKDRICNQCGSTMDEMGYQVKRVIKIRPAQVYVEEHRRYKYVCQKCSFDNQADGGLTKTNITVAPLPENVTPIEGSCASASLVAYIMERKYCLGLPLYRIESDLKTTANLTMTRQQWLAGSLKLMTDGYQRYTRL